MLKKKMKKLEMSSDHTHTHSPVLWKMAPREGTPPEEVVFDAPGETFSVGKYLYVLVRL